MTQAGHASPGTSPEDMRQSRAWTGHLASSAATLPISFECGERKLSGIPASWHPIRTRRRIDANLIETVFTGAEPATGLAVRLEWLEYLDFPVVEWTAWLTNQGDQATPRLSDIRAMDCAFRGVSPVLVHCNGDFNNEAGYCWQQTPILEGEPSRLAPRGGRPCDQAFPYFRMCFAGCGLTIAVGWPGQWAASFERTATGALVKAGQEKTSLRLLPGETIRTPRMTVLSWTGSQERSVNLWRRWYLAHVLPRPNGRPLEPKLAVCGPEEGEEFTASTEANQLRNIDRFLRRGFRFDVWWIDAGWYPCYNERNERKWQITGTWAPDPERFPHGMKAISDRTQANGADLLVWFEPERVRPGTWLDRERPEWLLRSSTTDNSLLNLGNPEVRRWLTDHVDRMIKDNGIGIYRQDFNFEPLDHWRSNEAEDRQGMNENLHVQGYLQYWDDLLERNAGLWIDSCASGGRRNDLETMRRSVPLHYTDHGYGSHPVKLAFHRTLYEWMPYFKECTLSWDLHGVERFDWRIDGFSFHCALAPMLFVALDIRREDYDYPLAVRLTALWRATAGLLLHGDYYPLTPHGRSSGEWVAWQFDRPEEGRGLIQAIRLQDCPQETLTVHLRALSAQAVYCLDNQETGETRESTGAELMGAGWRYTLPRRSGEVWLYHRKGSRGGL